MHISLMVFHRGFYTKGKKLAHIECSLDFSKALHIGCQNEHGAIIALTFTRIYGQGRRQGAIFC